MTIVFSPQGWEDYIPCQGSNRAILRRINRIIDDTCRDDPYAGIGRPEKLRSEIDAWSRRIDNEHRLVDRVEGDDLLLQARHRY